VKWEGSFSSHPLTSTTIPGGAAGWHAATGNVFIYEVKTAGTYHYKCDLHAGAGMVGQFTANATAVEEKEPTVLPGTYELDQNYPNPFNSSTNVRFTVSKPGDAVLSLYDASGRTLFQELRQSVQPGDHVFNLDLSAYPSGNYFYRLSFDHTSQVRKMTLIK
jgi:hypothetical protein